MNDINDVHQFNMLPTPEQIKVLRTTILKRLRAEEPTLRDQFAMAALTGIISNSMTHKQIIESGNGLDKITDITAGAAYQYADSMMKARETP